MTSGTWAGTFALILVAMGTSAARLSTPAHADAGSDEMLPALLVEMKGLRAAMEQMASSGTQAQIAIGRLQVQEHRVTSLVDRPRTPADAALVRYSHLRSAGL